MLSIKKVGIALAVYRPELSSFQEQLVSIQAQTWKSWICVIASDSPLNEFQPYLEVLADSRFICLENHSRLGHKKNFERAIQETLKYGVDAIACSDQDDRWYPNKISKSVEQLEKVGSLSLVHSDMDILKRGVIEPVSVWHLERRQVQYSSPIHLIVRNKVTGCSMLFDAELARKFPVIPKEVEYHDHWYALIASFLGRVSSVCEPLLAYRQHERNAVGVTEYRTNWNLLRKVGIGRALFQKAQIKWQKSKAIAEAIDRAGLSLGPLLRFLFLNRWDGGILFCYLGMRYLITDPALSQEFFKCSLGKFFSFSRRDE